MADRTNPALGTSYDPLTDLLRHVREPVSLDPYPAPDVSVAVGDLESAARGSGARKNSGKPAWWQFPFWALRRAPTFAQANAGEWAKRNTPTLLDELMTLLARWQRRQEDSGTLETALALGMFLLARERREIDQPEGGAFSLYEAILPVVRVLEFGAVKYKPGNWAKGMSWNVTFTCAMSHLLKRMSGRTQDEESGQPHLAHFVCNLLFLSAYLDLYPEGDDRMKEFGEVEISPYLRGAPNFPESATEASIRAQSSHQIDRTADGRVYYLHGPYCLGCDALFHSGPPADQVHP